MESQYQLVEHAKSNDGHWSSTLEEAYKEVHQMRDWVREEPQAYKPGDQETDYCVATGSDILDSIDLPRAEIFKTPSVYTEDQSSKGQLTVIAQRGRDENAEAPQLDDNRVARLDSPPLCIRLRHHPIPFDESMSQLEDQNHRLRLQQPSSDVPGLLPKQMQMNTMLAVSLNMGEVFQRKWLVVLGDCKSTLDIFTKVAAACKGEKIDERDITIEVKFKDGRIANLSRDDEWSLAELFRGIKDNPCWQRGPSGWCYIDVNICQKWTV